MAIRVWKTNGGKLFRWWLQVCCNIFLPCWNRRFQKSNFKRSSHDNQRVTFHPTALWKLIYNCISFPVFLGRTPTNLPARYTVPVNSICGGRSGAASPTHGAKVLAGFSCRCSLPLARWVAHLGSIQINRYRYNGRISRPRLIYVHVCSREDVPGLQ